MDNINEITKEIIDAAIKIHKQIGPGLLESVYEMVLVRELQLRKLKIETQKYISFEYEGMVFKNAFKIDVLVEETVLIEIKSLEKILPVHSKQLLTYLKLMNNPVGILLNFGMALMKDGIHRIVNQYNPS
ncbi:GxxExxY protein [Leptospira selangorensis]|uniref:GxxExxY protein n=1 Tax=Leptospira selangorensis TaxID=2484982 RepID=UPI0010831B73|nr:GxxExxY protein [Leptospira selangorensis]TGK06038.1 GxxExxY protein [Leptospira selangorensis]